MLAFGSPAGSPTHHTPVPSHHRSTGVFQSDSGMSHHSSFDRQPSHHHHSVSSPSIPKHTIQPPPSHPAGLPSSEFHNNVMISATKTQYEGKRVAHVLSKQAAAAAQQRKASLGMVSSPGSIEASPQRQRRAPRSSRNTFTGIEPWSNEKPIGTGTISGRPRKLELGSSSSSSSHHPSNSPVTGRKNSFPNNETLNLAISKLLASPVHATAPTGGLVIPSFPNLVEWHGQLQTIVKVALESDVIDETRAAEVKSATKWVFSAFTSIVLEMQQGGSEDGAGAKFPVASKETMQANNIQQQHSQESKEDIELSIPSTSSTAQHLEAASPAATPVITNPLPPVTMDTNAQTILPESVFYTNAKIAATLANTSSSSVDTNATQTLTAEQSKTNGGVSKTLRKSFKLNQDDCESQEMTLAMDQLQVESSPSGKSLSMKQQSKQKKQRAVVLLHDESHQSAEESLMPQLVTAITDLPLLQSVEGFDLPSQPNSPRPINNSNKPNPVRRDTSYLPQQQYDYNSPTAAVHVYENPELTFVEDVMGVENQQIHQQHDHISDGKSLFHQVTHHQRHASERSLSHGISKHRSSYSIHSHNGIQDEWQEQEDHSHREILAPLQIQIGSALTQSGNFSRQSGSKNFTSSLPSHPQTPRSAKSPLTPRTVNTQGNNPSLLSPPSPAFVIVRKHGQSPLLTPTRAPAGLHSSSGKAKKKGHARSQTFSTLSFVPEITLTVENGTGIQQQRKPSFQPLPRFDTLTESRIETEAAHPSPSNSPVEIDPHLQALQRARQRESKKKSLDREPSPTIPMVPSITSVPSIDPVTALLTDSPPRPPRFSQNSESKIQPDIVPIDTNMIMDNPVEHAEECKTVEVDSILPGASPSIHVKSNSLTLSPGTLSSLRDRILTLQREKQSTDIALRLAYDELTRERESNRSMLMALGTLRHRFMQRAFTVVKIHSTGARGMDANVLTRLASSLHSSQDKRFFALSLDGLSLWWSRDASFTLESRREMSLLSVYDLKISLVGLFTDMPGDSNILSKANESRSFSLLELMRSQLLSTHLTYDSVSDSIEFPTRPSTEDFFLLRRQLYQSALYDIHPKRQDLALPPVSDEFEQEDIERGNISRFDAEESGEDVTNRFQTPNRSTSTVPFPSPLKHYHAAHWKVTFVSTERSLSLLFPTKSDLDVWVEFIQRMMEVKHRRKMEEFAKEWKLQRTHRKGSGDEYPPSPSKR